MRIPFIPKSKNPESSIPADQLAFIKSTKAGSPFLYAGGLFWLIGAVVATIAPSIKVPYVIYAGLGVPLVGYAVAKIQKVNVLVRSPYTSLAFLAIFIELAAIPLMIYFRHSNIAIIPAILLLMDGAHLLIYMWIHLDYYYFIAGYLKIILAVLFLFGVMAKGDYAIQMLAGGLISIVAAFLVARDSLRTVELYRK